MAENIIEADAPARPNHVAKYGHASPPSVTIVEFIGEMKGFVNI